MAVLKTYRCEKLHATISLASCEANRNKLPERRKKGASSSVTNSLMPSACRDCEDWKHWGEENEIPLAPLLLRHKTDHKNMDKNF